MKTGGRKSKGKEEISDAYIKSLLRRRYGLNNAEIPAEFIEMKREQLLEKRLVSSLLKKLKEYQKGTSKGG